MIKTMMQTLSMELTLKETIGIEIVLILMTLFCAFFAFFDKKMNVESAALSRFGFFAFLVGDLAVGYNILEKCGYTISDIVSPLVYIVLVIVLVGIGAAGVSYAVSWGREHKGQ